MTVLINGAQGLLDHSGEALGATEWETMTFERIQAFADATDDHQWIHVDRERIAKESPFGAPIAHGYLTLSLVAGKFFDLLELQGFDMVINYGLEKVRFPNPLKEGQRFRLAFTLGNVSEKRGWYEALFIATIEIEGEAAGLRGEAVYRFKPSA